MKKKRVLAGFIAFLLLALMPMGALALEGGEEARYEACLQQTLRQLEAMPALEFSENPIEEAPRVDEPFASAQEGDMPDVEEEISMEQFFQEDGAQEVVSEQLFNAIQDGDGTMYSQLTQRQKICYNALVNVPVSQVLTASKGPNGYRQVKLSVTGVKGITFSGYVSGGSFKLDSAGAAAQKSLMTDLRAAIVSLYSDRPDMVWIRTMSYGYSSTRVSSTKAQVTTVNFSFALDFGGIEGQMHETMMEAADIIARGAASQPDQYRKVRLVHDVLVKANTYNHAAADNAISGLPYEMSHCAYSALIPGDSYEPVCDGYSEAFKLVCDRLKIYCAVPVSETHMWNNVKMDDGLWYNVDVTWDDDDRDEICTDYFLIGSQTVVDGQAFSRQPSHVEKNPFTPNTATNNLTLRFPTKRATAYQYLGHDYPPLRFPDVGRGAWYYEYVEDAAEKGLIKGDSSGSFRPTASITRAEFVQVVVNMLKVDTSGYTNSYFTDVSASKWYAKPIAWIKEAGIMSGDAGGTFRPEAPITRQEMCLVLYNLAKRQGVSTSTSSGRFADDGKISSWAKEAVYACKELGLVKGDDKNCFAPGDKTERCAAATVFVRYQDAAGDASGIIPAPLPTPTPVPAPSPKPGIDGTVYWVPNGSVYHSTRSCASLHNSSTIYSGTVANAQAAGKKNPCKVCH